MKSTILRTHCPGQMKNWQAEQERIKKFYAGTLDQNKRKNEPKIDVYAMKPKGTCSFHPNYSEEEAIKDAATIRRAMKGIGCNNAKLIQVAGNRSNEQRKMIKDAFKSIDARIYSDMYGDARDLDKDLKAETKTIMQAEYYNLISAVFMNDGEFDARIILSQLALMDCFNFPELFVEILCTRTNKQMSDMKLAWKRDLGRHKSMKEEISFELRNSMKTNIHFQSLITNLISWSRSEKSDKDKMKTMAKEMFDAIKSDNLEVEQMNLLRNSLIGLFSFSCFEDIAAFCNEFDHISKIMESEKDIIEGFEDMIIGEDKNKLTMQVAMTKLFEKDSDIYQAMLLIESFCCNRYDFWAERLRNTMKGLGTDDANLIRIIVDRSEIDLFQIRAKFDECYGDNKNLNEWIIADTSGSYKKLLLLLCGYIDGNVTLREQVDLEKKNEKKEKVLLAQSVCYL